MRAVGGESKMSAWRCPICGYMAEGLDPPQECPSCFQPGDTFEFIDDDEAYLDELESSEEFGS